MSARIPQAFAKKRAAFIPYLTAGDPTLEATGSFVKSLAAAGADLIELGVPFSDPLADGPVNQRAAQRALARGTALRDVIALVGRLRGEGLETPLILFTYFNPVFALGLERFAELAAQAGIDGALVVDLPPEEAGPYREAMRARGLSTVFLASPTTPAARLPLIDDVSSGFVYYVSRTGTTGARSELPEALAEELADVRARLRQPLAVGFGISTPAQARRVAAHADGVVVGSALVELIERSRDTATACQAIEAFAHSILRELRNPSC